MTLRRWTEEELWAAPKRFLDRYGHTPRQVDWDPYLAERQGHPELAERYRADGCWPHPTTAMRRFGLSWPSYLFDAGVEPTQWTWDRDSILEAVLEWMDDNGGRVPTRSEWPTFLNMPSLRTVQRHCGSMRQACIDAAARHGRPAPLR